MDCSPSVGLFLDQRILKMKKLAIWGTKNPVKTRFIIALCHIILITLGISFGIGLYLEDILIAKGLLPFLVIVFSVAYLLYPKRGIKEGWFKYSWSRRVKHDVVMALTYSCILTISVNQFAFRPMNAERAPAQVSLMVAKPGITPVIFSKKEIKKGNKSLIRKYATEIKQQLKAFKAERKEQQGHQVPLKIFLVLLVIALAAACFAGIGALSCELSCAGQEGAAIIVAVIGTASIIILSVIAIRAIVRIGKKPVVKPDTTTKDHQLS
jgi:protein-S-isoprenylcysteine O-methyltransferase Ste14